MSFSYIKVTSQEPHGVLDHRQFDCLLNCLFRLTWKETSKLALLALCEGNSPVTGGFPSQRDSNVESVSISRRHHVFIPDPCNVIGLSLERSMFVQVDIYYYCNILQCLCP